MEDRVRTRGGAILAGTMISVLIAALDNTLVGTAMPAVVRDLGISGDPGSYSWPFTAQLIAETATVPLAGKLSDSLGRKKVLLAGILVYITAALACGLAGSMEALSAFRALAGVGGGILISSSFAIVAEVFPVRERGKYVGLVASMFSLASLTGPLVGGFVTEALSWRWAFLASLPLGLAAFLLIALTLPALKPERASGAFDGAGTLLFLGASLPFLLAFSEGGSSIPWASPAMAALFMASALFLALFVLRERKAANPLLPPSLFRNRSFRVSTASALIAYAGFFGCVIFLPRLAQESFGFSPGKAGLLLIPLTIGMMIAGNVGGRVVGMTRRFRIAGSSGFCLAAVGALVLAAAARGGSVPGVVAGEFIMGLGVGFTLPVYNMASQFSFPLSVVGLVTALIEFFQDLGGAVGSSVIGAIAAMAPGASGRGESLAFVASAIILAVGAALMWRLDEAAVIAGMDAQGRGARGDQALGVKQ